MHGWTPVLLRMDYIPLDSPDEWLVKSRWGEKLLLLLLLQLLLARRGWADWKSRSFQGNIKCPTVPYAPGLRHETPFISKVIYLFSWQTNFFSDRSIFSLREDEV